MNSSDLKDLQGPIKEKYSERPETAMITLRAEGQSIATGIDVLECTVLTEGDLDFRGTLGVSKEAAVGFKAIRLSFLLDTSASPAEIEILKKLTEKYCYIRRFQ